MISITRKEMRLNQFLAAGGVGSRRDCDEIIRSGRVRINGHVVVEMGTRVRAEDVVKVGQRVIRPHRTVTIALNKPRGVLTTCDDPGKRKTVLDLVPPGLGRLFPVGRLDMESEGLLLLTNDGSLSQRLTHPSHGVEKEYVVTLTSPFDLCNKPRLLRGFQIEGGRARMEAVHFHSPQSANIILKQGIKRQIRLMFHELGYEVRRLKRIRIGPLKLGSLPSGSWSELTPAQLSALMVSRQMTRQ
jgi:23S rRNA pseudouridine2605 synthase